MSTDALLVYCTCPDEETARRLAGLLVDKQLAACVNIISGVTSVYRWQGNIEQDNEVLLLIKTNKKHYAGMEGILREHHPYELPEIVAVSIITGLPDYLQWLNNSVG